MELPHCCNLISSYILGSDACHNVMIHSRNFSDLYGFTQNITTTSVPFTPPRVCLKISGKSTITSLTVFLLHVLTHLSKPLIDLFSVNVNNHFPNVSVHFHILRQQIPLVQSVLSESLLLSAQSHAMSLGEPEF